MKKIILIIITIVLFNGCLMGFDSDMGYVCPIKVSSNSIFSINGELFTEVKKTPEFKIYNPNNYEIEVNVGDASYTIEPYSYIKVEEPSDVWT